MSKKTPFHVKRKLLNAAARRAHKKYKGVRFVSWDEPAVAVSLTTFAVMRSILAQHVLTEKDRREAYAGNFPTPPSPSSD